MKSLLVDEKYAFVSEEHKEFIAAFDAAMIKAGYQNNGIQPYVVFGKYKIEYAKAALKSKKYVARVYLRDHGIALRLYFTGIDKHAAYIESAPDFIKSPFTDDRGKCKHCDKEGGGIGKKGKCSFKKTYALNGVTYDKCAGDNYFFDRYDIDAIDKYVELLNVFYPGRPKRGES